jgi:hypothetical protein
VIVPLVSAEITTVKGVPEHGPPGYEESGQLHKSAAQ